jgi:flagellar biosynthesis chaperone FliJ
MTQFTYRLQPLLEQKEEAKKEAERQQARQEQELESQSAVLRSLQHRERELVEKREQLRRELLSKPSRHETLTAQEVLARSEYVKTVGLEIEEARNDVLAQRQLVEQCELRVQEAKKRAAETRREVEVLTKHRAKQEERFLRELQVQEERALDEIGNALYTNRRRLI